jgi:hypothetical protein
LTDELAGARIESMNNSTAIDTKQTQSSDAVTGAVPKQPRQKRDKNKIICKFYQTTGGKCTLPIRGVSKYVADWVVLIGENVAPRLHWPPKRPRLSLNACDLLISLLLSILFV